MACGATAATLRKSILVQLNFPACNFFIFTSKQGIGSLENAERFD
jgi:hypothetical protein